MGGNSDGPDDAGPDRQERPNAKKVSTLKGSGLDVSDAKRLSALEGENAKLPKILTTEEEVETRLTAPMEQARKRQVPADRLLGSQPTEAVTPGADRQAGKSSCFKGSNRSARQPPAPQYIRQQPACGYRTGDRQGLDDG